MSYRSLDENRVKLIELFTQRGQEVLEPHLYYGDSLIAALFADREFVGVAQSQKQCDEIMTKMDFHMRNKQYTLIIEENKDKALKKIHNESIDLQTLSIDYFAKFYGCYCFNFAKNAKHTLCKSHKNLIILLGASAPKTLLRSNTPYATALRKQKL